MALFVENVQVLFTENGLRQSIYYLPYSKEFKWQKRAQIALYGRNVLAEIKAQNV